MFFRNKTLKNIPTLTDTGNQYVDMYVNRKEIFKQVFPFDFVKPEHTVIACGSRGDLCETGQSDPIILSQLAKHVIIVEAETKNIKMLETYIKKNNIENITLVNRIIWNDKTELDFMCYPKSAASRVGKSNKVKTEKYETTTLTSLMNEFGPIDFVHLTVNGAEHNAIRGARKLTQYGTVFSIAFLGKDKEIFETRKKAIEKLQRSGYCIGWEIYNGEDPVEWKASSDDPVGRLHVSKVTRKENIKKLELGQYGFCVAIKDKNKLISLGFEED